MSLKLPKLNQILSASFIGLLLGAAGLYYTVRGTRTHVTYEVVSKSSVLDVKQPVPNLSILFQGKDIEQEHTALTIFTLRVVNDGESSIREDDFDSHQPFGVKVTEGRIVRVQLVGSNSTYLSSNLQPTLLPSNIVSFSKVIFDRGAFANIELLVLHAKSREPGILPIGKIAGVDQMPVVDTSSAASPKTYLNQIWTGGAAVQAGRVLFYSIIGLCLIVGSIFTVFGLSSIGPAWRKRKRRKLVNEIAPALKDQDGEAIQILEDIYVEDGIHSLRKIRRVLEDEAELRKLALSHAKTKRRRPRSQSAEFYVMRNRERYQLETLRYPAFVKSGLLAIDGDNTRVSPSLSEALSALIQRIEYKTDS